MNRRTQYQQIVQGPDQVNDNSTNLIISVPSSKRDMKTNTIPENTSNFLTNQHKFCIIPVKNTEISQLIQFWPQH